MADSPLFITSRTKLVAEYKARSRPYVANTKPYKSADTLRGRIVNTVLDASPAAIACFLVFDAGTKLEFFTKGLGQQHARFGQMTDAETNLAAAFRTNGGEDFCIEAISSGCRGYRVAVNDDPLLPHVAKITDDKVKAALAGNGVLCDPGCLVVPPQIGSPFNLENAVFEAVAPYVSIFTEFNRKAVGHIGTLDQFPEGTGRSYLRTHGEPAASNRFKTPEGLIWRGGDGPDSQFCVKGMIERDVVIPITPIVVAGDTTASVPKFIDLEIVLRLHGLALSYPSGN